MRSASKGTGDTDKVASASARAPVAVLQDDDDEGLRNALGVTGAKTPFFGCVDELKGKCWMSTKSGIEEHLQLCSF